MDFIHVHVWRKTLGVHALHHKFEFRVFDMKDLGVGISYKHRRSKEFERKFKRVGI